MKQQLLYIILAVLMLCSCGMSERRDAALRTVAEADSLRRVGALYSDSLALAKSVVTLKQYSVLRPNDYLRACYYYGRLLRRQGDLVSAMQAFIDGMNAQYLYKPIPNPRFSDYSIMGRIYSNMGTMCHLIDSFQLSYEMYDRCAEQFLKASDSTMYHYARNAMALQLAEQKKHDETLALLNRIEQECSDTVVLSKIWETMAQLYMKCERYDSVLFSVRQLQGKGNNEPTGYVLKAQALWRLHQYDSAIYYAKYVMDNTHCSAVDKYNMMYILAYNDPTLNKDDIKKRSEERADIDREVLDPMRVQVSQAAHILRLDLEDRSHLLNLILLAASVFVLTIALLFLRRHHRHTLEHISEKQDELRTLTLEEEQRQQDLRQNQEQLLEENDVIRNDTEIIRRQHEEHRRKMLCDIESSCEAIRNSRDWREVLHWKNYIELCETTNRFFFLLADKLEATGKVDEKEIRLCILVLLDQFSNKQLAEALIYSESGIGTFKYRVSRKFNIRSKDLRGFLLEMAISGSNTADSL